METAEQREQRIQRLERDRAARRGAEAQGGVWPTPDDAGIGVLPVQIAPGRGDLQHTSTGFLPSFPTALARLGGGYVSFARIFQSQPWVAAAVMWMLTRAIRVPLKAYRRAGGENDRIRLRPGDHPIADMIVNPWPRGNQAQLTMNLLGPILVHGNSVTEIDDTANSGQLQLTPKDWRYSWPIMPWRASLEGFKFDSDIPMFMHEVSIDKILHLAWWSPIGPIGTSPLMQLGITMELEDAAQRFQKATFVNGARPPSAVVASEAFLGIDPVERRQIMRQLRMDLTALFSGPENAGKPALLPPGLDWKPVGQTTVEAALVDQRKVNREEVCGVYLIPPPLLGILERATFSNIQIQRDMVYTDCLGPPLILLEQGINGQIIRDLLQDDEVFVEYDFGAVLRGDRLAEIQALRDAVGTALMSPNESRGVLNLPHVADPAMDQFYLPVNNLQPIGSPASRTPRDLPIDTPAPGDGMPGDGAPEEVPSPQRGLGRRLHVRSRERDFVRQY